MSGFKSDHQIVRDYITAADHLQYTQLPEDVVAITMTHSNIPTKHVDLRLNLHLTIAEVKERFRLHIGTPVDYQQLFLRDGSGQRGLELSDNSKKLGYYSPQSGMEIHIVDHDPYSLSRNGGLTDVSLVQKFTISDEAYDKRKGTMREWIKEKKKANPNFKLTPNMGRAGGTSNSETSSVAGDVTTTYGAETVQGIEIGKRCEVEPGARRGTVRYVGEVILEEKSKGYWVGVQFDEPLGHNDGSFKDQKLFDCAVGYGAFVRGDKVKIGDFPERDILDEEDEEEDEI